MGLPVLSLLVLWNKPSFQALFLLPTALVLGIVALLRIRRSDGTLRGYGFAIAGTVLGLAGTLALAVFILVARSALQF